MWDLSRRRHQSRYWSERRESVLAIDGPADEMRGRQRGDGPEGRSGRRRNRFARNGGAWQHDGEDKRDEDRKEPPGKAAGVRHDVCLSAIGIGLMSHVVGVPDFLAL